jgi:hypothetical protein
MTVNLYLYHVTLTGALRGAVVFRLASQTSRHVKICSSHKAPGPRG